jgi:hypothetical protein
VVLSQYLDIRRQLLLDLPSDSGDSLIPQVIIDAVLSLYEFLLPVSQ